MATKVAVKKDNEFTVVKLDAVYAKTLATAQSAADKFVQHKETFQRTLKQVGASGSLPMSDKDYKILSEAKDVKARVETLEDLQMKAQICLFSVDGAADAMKEATKDDAADTAKEAATILSAAIDEKERQVAETQKEIAALKKDLAGIAREIAKTIQSKIAPLQDEANEIKKALPAWVSKGKPFEFERWQKYLKAKLK